MESAESVIRGRIVAPGPGNLPTSHGTWLNRAPSNSVPYQVTLPGRQEPGARTVRLTGGLKVSRLPALAADFIPVANGCYVAGPRLLHFKKESRQLMRSTPYDTKQSHTTRSSSSQIPKRLTQTARSLRSKHMSNNPEAAGHQGGATDSFHAHRRRGKAVACETNRWGQTQSHDFPE